MIAGFVIAILLASNLLGSGEGSKLDIVISRNEAGAWVEVRNTKVDEGLIDRVDVPLDEIVDLVLSDCEICRNFPSQKLRFVSTIRLTRCSFEGHDAGSFSNLVNLRELELIECGVDQGFLESLPELAKLEKLVVIEERLTITALRFLEKFPRLSWVMVFGGDLKTAGQFTNELSKISFGNADVSVQFIDEVGRSANAGSSLTLTRSQLEDGVIAAIASANVWQNVAFSKIPLNIEDLQLLADSKSLKKLDLSHCDLTEDELKYLMTSESIESLVLPTGLSPGFHFRRIVELAASRRETFPWTISHGGVVRFDEKLQGICLKLSDETMSLDDWIEFRQELSFCAAIDLDGVELDAELLSSRLLSSVVDLSLCKDFKLTNIDISQAFVRRFEAGQGVEKLAISQCDFGSDSLRSLGALFSNATVYLEAGDGVERVNLIAESLFPQRVVIRTSRSEFEKVQAATNQMKNVRVVVAD